MSFLELHDARGSVPRGQHVPLHKSPSSILEDFSAENGPTSWTEDNVSVFSIRPVRGPARARLLQ